MKPFLAGFLAMAATHREIHREKSGDFTGDFTMAITPSHFHRNNGGDNAVQTAMEAVIAVLSHYPAGNY